LHALAFPLGGVKGTVLSEENGSFFRTYLYDKKKKLQFDATAKSAAEQKLVTKTSD